MNARRNVYGYVRVSTQTQADEGLSLDNQKKKIESWANLFDHDLVKIYADEGVTGRSIEKREGLKQLLDVIKENEILVVYSFSRLSRSVRDFLSITTLLNERNCQIVILKEGLDTSTAHGRFSATLMSALAQLESDITSERVKDAMQHKVDKGEHVGRPPYGWKLESGKGSGLIPVEHEQVIIRRIKGMREIQVNAKPMSYQKIADRLNQDAVPLPGKSKKWYHSAVSRICNRKTTVTKGRPIKDEALEKIKAEFDREQVEDNVNAQIQHIDQITGFSKLDKSSVASKTE